MNANAAEQMALSALAIAPVLTVQSLFGVEIGVATAAAIGAVGSLFWNGNLRGREAVSFVFLGFALGTYGAVPALDYLGKPEQWKYLAALVLGMFGMSVLAIVWKKWQANPVNPLKDKAA